MTKNIWPLIVDEHSDWDDEIPFNGEVSPGEIRIGESGVPQIWEWAVANPHVPRTAVAGLLLAAGLDAENAEDASWYIVRERAENGDRSAIIELASACSFEANTQAWLEGHGMTEAGRVSDQVYYGVYSAYQNGRDRLDAVLAIASLELEAA